MKSGFNILSKRYFQYWIQESATYFFSNKGYNKVIILQASLKKIKLQHILSFQEASGNVSR